MTQPPQPNKKLNLKVDEVLELKVWFMIARQPKIEIQNEKVIAVLAYRLEDALAKAKEEAKELTLVFHGQAIPVRELIEKIYLEGVVSPPPVEPSTIKEVPKEKMSQETFKASLLLVLNEFCPPEDKENLKKIIEKI